MLGTVVLLAVVLQVMVVVVLVVAVEVLVLFVGAGVGRGVDGAAVGCQDGPAVVDGACCSLRQPPHVTELQNCTSMGAPRLVLHTHMYQAPGDTHSQSPWAKPNAFQQVSA